MTALVERKNNWKATESNFRWEIPDVFNIAEAVCDRHAEDPAKVALIHENDSGTVESWTFRQIQQYANRLANAMEALGICEGDRVGIVCLNLLKRESPILRFTKSGQWLFHSPISLAPKR